MQHRLLYLLFTLVLVLLSGCGYYSPYVQNSKAAPISLHRSMWANQTNELGLESVIYHALSDWMRRTNLIALKEKTEDSQYTLTGKIISVDFPEIAYGNNNVATELRARLTVAYSLVDNKTTKIIWNKQETYSETFKQNANPSQLQTNKKEALAEIADDIAEEIYLHIIKRVIRK